MDWVRFSRRARVQAATLAAKGHRFVTRDDGYEDLAGAVVRFGRADGSTDPFYGLELQTNAVPGLKSEGSARFLPKLKYSLEGPALDKGVNAGARLAMPPVWPGRIRRVPDVRNS